MTDRPIDKIKDNLWSMQKARARDALFLSDQSIMQLMTDGALFLKINVDDTGYVTQQVIPADQVMFKGEDDN